MKALEHAVMYFIYLTLFCVAYYGFHIQFEFIVFFGIASILAHQKTYNQL